MSQPPLPATTRRTFLLGAGVSLAAGASVAWLGVEGRGRNRSFSGRTTEVKRPKAAMPGPFPAVSSRFTIVARCARTARLTASPFSR